MILLKIQNTALLIIDYTNDFVAEGGTLTSGKRAQDLHDYILKTTLEQFARADYVAFSVDLHFEDDKYHPETDLFPEHNIEGTDGRKLYGELETFYQEAKASKDVEYFDKTRYSAFAGTNLEMKLRARDITEVHLMGVCTDICILHTAIDAYNKGFNIVVHENGVASFDEEGHEWTLGHIQNVLGGSVI